MTTKQDPAAEFAKDFKTKAQRYAAETGYKAGQKYQLEDDIECTSLFIKRLCIRFKIADVPNPKLEDMERMAEKVVAQFKKEMREL